MSKAKFKLLCSQDGSALLFALSLGAITLIGITALVFQINRSAKTAGAVLNRKKTFYIGDGLSRIVTHAANEWLDSHPVVDMHDPVYLATVRANVETYIKSQLPTPPGYVNPAPDLQVRSLTPSGSRAPIQYGPFAGMDSSQYLLEFSLKTKTTAIPPVVASTRQVALLAQISMFEFLQFLAQGGSIIYGKTVEFSGRVYSGSDLCIGSNSSMTFLQPLIVAGKLRQQFNCSTSNPMHYPYDHVYIASRMNDASSVLRFGKHADHDCTGTSPTSCNTGAVTGRSWGSFAVRAWKGMVHDSAHGVKHLSLPITNPTPLVQPVTYFNGNGPGFYPNHKFRILVDPVLVNKIGATETTDVQRQKLAYKSDIRIINGVWYLRDLANLNAWPGIPIWSDHPGSYKVDSSTSTKNDTEKLALDGDRVGQADLMTARAWQTSPLLAPPLRYSYYVTNGAGALLDPNPILPAVISYGTLKRSLLPYLAGDKVTSETTGIQTAATGPGYAVWLPAFYQGSSLTLNPAANAFGFLQATRSGITNPQLLLAAYTIQRNGGVLNSGIAKILPMNMDIDAFGKALQDTRQGELGHYFAGSGRQFNGIIYVTNTWPGSLNGFDNAANVQDPPPQGTVSDPNQPGPYTTRNDQQALPYNLCSDAPVSSILATGPASFKVPACDRNHTGTPSHLRIINATRLLAYKTQMPFGLTIATNLPLYLQGHFNRLNNILPNQALGTRTPSDTTDWMPTLVASDYTIHLSDNWNDSNVPWSPTSRNSIDVKGSSNPRPATNTSYNTANISADTGYFEDWGYHQTAKSLNIGSSALAYGKVYNSGEAEDLALSISSYDPPHRIFTFDEHYALVANQPPGTPVFNLTAILQWDRNP